MELFETKSGRGKTVPVTQKQVREAWLKVRKAKGAAGCDGKTISDFEQELEAELYKVWNRMASGSYHSQPVKAVSIPKWDGSQRWLGVPTVGDRIAQQVVKEILEPELEKVFHPDSFGYRPNRSTHDALKQCVKRCWDRAWVIDLDIKGFFDNIDHDLLVKALERHTEQSWIIRYIKRWLKAPMKYPGDTSPVSRDKGTPQGGVISPLLANLFLHYAFDKWMEKELPWVPFERYADDIIIHCNSEYEAEKVLEQVIGRLKVCKLDVHPTKTKIVYCRDKYRKREYPRVSFDFLGFTFQPRKTKQRNGEIVLGYGPAVSKRAKSHFISKFRSLKIHRWTSKDIDEIADEIAQKLMGWINYFGKYRKWEMYPVFRSLNDRLVKWMMNKYKKYRRKLKLAREKLKQLAREFPNLFEHWKHRFFPT